MAKTPIQIHYVDKTTNDHPSITHLGTLEERISKRELIRRMEEDKIQYFTHANGKSAWLEVVAPVNEPKYVRTVRDGISDNNRSTCGRPPLRKWPDQRQNC